MPVILLLFKSKPFYTVIVSVYVCLWLLLLNALLSIFRLVAPNTKLGWKPNRKLRAEYFEYKNRIKAALKETQYLHISQIVSSDEKPV